MRNQQIDIHILLTQDSVIKTQTEKYSEMMC